MSLAPRRLSIPTTMPQRALNNSLAKRTEEKEEKSPLTSSDSISSNGSLFHTPQNSSSSENLSTSNFHDSKFTAAFKKYYKPANEIEEKMSFFLKRNDFIFNRHVANELARNNSDVADVLEIIDKNLLDAYTSDGDNKIELIQAALDEGADINAYLTSVNGGMCVLMSAILTENNKILKLILKYKINQEVHFDLCTKYMSIKGTGRMALRKLKASPLGFAMFFIQIPAIKCFLPVLPNIDIIDTNIGIINIHSFLANHCDFLESEEISQKKLKIKEMIIAEKKYRKKLKIYNENIEYYNKERFAFLLGMDKKIGKDSPVLKLSNSDPKNISKAILSYIRPKLPLHPFAVEEE